MIDGKRILAVIPARGGSKGLPKKNILPLGGKPLIAWSIEAAHGSRYLDRTILSSDDPAIAEVASDHGCDVPFIRPAALATDASPTMDTLLHAVDQVEPYDLLVLLQPTSPLRNSEDIDRAIELMLEHKANTCVSVTEASKSPYWMFECTDTQRLKPVIAQSDTATRRQDLPDVYVLNGAVYVARIDWLREKQTFLHEETLAYVMPRERSLDIDEAMDMRIAGVMLEECSRG